MPLYVGKDGKKRLLSQISTGITTIVSDKLPGETHVMMFEVEGHKLIVTDDEADRFLEMVASVRQNLRDRTAEPSTSDK